MAVIEKREKGRPEGGWVVRRRKEKRKIGFLSSFRIVFQFYYGVVF